MSFKKLGVCSELIDLLRSKGITKPTEVQQGCIPSIIKGGDVVACAKTGSGKTATFLVPILQVLMSEPIPFYALVITPTRELAHQIGEQAAGLNLVNGSSICSVHVITGGRSIVQQGIELARGPNIIVATPGRLADLLRSQQAAAESNEEREWSLLRTRVVVLDEADRLLEDNFGADLALIMQNLPAKRQTLLFSATFSEAVQAAVKATKAMAEAVSAKEGGKQTQITVWQPPDSVDDSATGSSSVGATAQQKSSAGVSRARTVSTLSQYYLLMKPEHKESFLVHAVDQFLTENPHSMVIVFTNKCKWCHLLGMVFNSLGLSSVVLHSAMPQRERIRALTSFRSSHVRVLVATDLASRGLDCPTVDLVINHNVPMRPQDYLHRVGRTARAGKIGMALTLADLFEINRLKEIQTFIGKKLEKFVVNEKEVAKIIAEVSIARRDAERKLDEIRFDEKREIHKAKKLIKKASSKED